MRYFNNTQQNIKNKNQMLSFLKQWPMPTTRFAVRCVTTSSHSKQQAATRPQQAKPFNSIPGPKPLPLLGNLLDIVRVRRRGQRFSDFNYEGLEKYGGIMKLLIPGVLHSLLYLTINIEKLGRFQLICKSSFSYCLSL